MPNPDPFRYDDRHVLVVGGASGMGEAAVRIAADRGARVTVVDHTDLDHSVHTSLRADLRELAAVDAALGRVDGPVDAVVCAAGVADGTPGLMRVNFIGHRHIVETLVADGRLGRGGAICMISSVAGLGWERNIPTLSDFLATSDYSAASAWLDARGVGDYMFSKQAMNCYVAQQSFSLMTKGIRINAVCPGPTDTPLARANAETWLGFGQDYRAATGLEPLSPDEIGSVITFLNSDAARGISGVNLLVDQGYIFSSLSGGYEPGAMIQTMLLGQPAQ